MNLRSGRPSHAHVRRTHVRRIEGCEFESGGRPAASWRARGAPRWPASPAPAMPEGERFALEAPGPRSGPQRQPIRSTADIKPSTLNRGADSGPGVKTKVV